VLLQLGSSDLFAGHNFVVLNGSDRRRDRSGSMIAVAARERQAAPAMSLSPSKSNTSGCGSGSNAVGLVANFLLQYAVKSTFYDKTGGLGHSPGGARAGSTC